MKKNFAIIICIFSFLMIVSSLVFVSFTTVQASDFEAIIRVNWGVPDNNPVVIIASENSEIVGKRVYITLMEKDISNRTVKSYNFDGIAGPNRVGERLAEALYHNFPKVSTSTVKIFVAAGIPDLQNYTTELETEVPLPDLVIKDLTYTRDISGEAVKFIIYNKNFIEGKVHPNIGQVSKALQWLDANKNPIGSPHIPGFGQSLLTRYDGQAVWQILRVELSNNWHSHYNPYVFENVPDSARFLKISIWRGAESNPETDTGNNSVEWTRPLPNLVIDNGSRSEENLTYRIRNIGTYPALVYTLFQWLDAGYNPVGNMFGSREQSFELDANGESVQNILNASSSGSSNQATVEDRFRREYIWRDVPASARFLRLSVKDLNGKPDMDDGNNKIDLVLPYPDLAVSSVNFDEQLGYAIPVIKNQGASDAGAFNVEIRWYKGKTPAGNPIELILDEGLRAGRAHTAVSREQRRNPPAEWLPPVGATAVVVKVDAGYAVEELIETNNESSFNRPLKYPIPELGNCKNKEDCKKYCDRSENASACAEFGVSRGLLTEEEAQALKDMVNIDDGPGGCTTKESCAEFCEKPANIAACLSYAEKNNWLTEDELSKARKVAKILEKGEATPGKCSTPGACKNYCSDNSHAVECVAFGKSTGLLTVEEAQEAEKIAPLMQGGAMPGGGKTREETEAYCDKKENRTECDKFFEAAGVKKGRNSEDEKGKGGTSLFEGREGGGPGGCKTKAECDAYCDSHPGECDEQVKEAGGEVKEITVPCSTNEECRKFCADPTNTEACKNIVIEESPEEAEASKPAVILAEIEKLRQNILEMPTQSQECVKQAWGAESFDRVMAGQAPETPVKAETLQSCYSSGVQQRDQMEMQNKPKPAGEGDEDDMYPPSSQIQRISSFVASIANVLIGWIVR